MLRVVQLSIHYSRPQSGGFVQCGHFSDKERGRVLQIPMSALFDAKNIGFSKFIVCPSARTRGQGVASADKGGSIFCDFVRKSPY